MNARKPAEKEKEWNFIRDQVIPDIQILEKKLKDGEISLLEAAEDLACFADILRKQPDPKDTSVVSYSIYQRLIAHLQSAIGELQSGYLQKHDPKELQDFIAEIDHLVHEVVTKAKRQE